MCSSTGPGGLGLERHLSEARGEGGNLVILREECNKLGISLDAPHPHVRFFLTRLVSVGFSEISERAGGERESIDDVAFKRGKLLKCSHLKCCSCSLCFMSCPVTSGQVQSHAIRACENVTKLWTSGSGRGEGRGEE